MADQREKVFDVYPVSDHVIALGGPYAYVYWVIGREAALIDAGTVVWGRKLVQAIPTYLDYEEFRYHLLTHSHYDHLGGTPELLEAFRDLQVLAHPHVQKVLKSPRALEHITRMNQKELHMWGRSQKSIDRYRFRPFRIHRTVQEGSKLDLGDKVVVEVLETPGHTRDSVTYIIHPDGVAIPGESVGVPNADGSFILPQFVSDYDAYLVSLKKVAERASDLEAIGLPHERLILGPQAVQAFLRESLETTQAYAADLAQALRASNGDLQVAKDRIFDLYYGPKKIRQPEFAFRANLRYQLRAIARSIGLI